MHIDQERARKINQRTLNVQDFTRALLVMPYHNTRFVLWPTVYFLMNNCTAVISINSLYFVHHVLYSTAPLFRMNSSSKREGMGYTLGVTITMKIYFLVSLKKVVYLLNTNSSSSYSNRMSTLLLRIN